MLSSKNLNLKIIGIYIINEQNNLPSSIAINVLYLKDKTHKMKRI